MNSEVIVHVPKVPNPKQADFIVNLTSEEASIHLYVGGAGAGKTQALVQGIIDCAFTLPGNKIAVVRKFSKDLNHTVMAEFQATINPNMIISEHKVDKEFVVRSKDKDTHSIVAFRGLDEKNRWGSTAWGQIFIEEANEIELADFLYLRTRLRHKLPAKVDISDSPYIKSDGQMLRFIAMSFNPPEQKEHWLRLLWLEKTILGVEKKITLVETSTYDNKKNLDPEYIQIMEDLPPGERERMLEGKPSLGILGKPCIPDFSDKCIFKGSRPLHPIFWHRGWDFGWHHPACVWAEVIDDCFWIWYAILGTDKELRDFYRDDIHSIEKLMHHDSEYKEYIDHQAASQHTDKSKDTSKKIMRDLGLTPRSTYSKPRDRTALINELCKRGRLFIHERCEDLITALRGGWHRKQDDPDEEEEDGYYEHLGDALGYLVWNMVGAKGRRPTRMKDIEEEEINDNSTIDIKGYLRHIIPVGNKIRLPGMGGNNRGMQRR